MPIIFIYFTMIYTYIFMHWYAPLFIHTYICVLTYKILDSVLNEVKKINVVTMEVSQLKRAIHKH
jgi:hypothetical protein